MNGPCSAVDMLRAMGDFDPDVLAVSLRFTIFTDCAPGLSGSSSELSSNPEVNSPCS